LASKLGRISKLKEAIDSLHEISKAQATIYEEIQIKPFKDLDYALARANQRLRNLKDEP